MKLSTQIELGIIRPSYTEIKWHYFSKNKHKYLPCKGWDNGCYDALQYLKYNYLIKAFPHDN